MNAMSQVLGICLILYDNVNNIDTGILNDTPKYTVLRCDIGSEYPKEGLIL